MPTKIIIDDNELTEMEVIRALNSLIGKPVGGHILYTLKMLAVQKRIGQEVMPARLPKEVKTKCK